MVCSKLRSFCYVWSTKWFMDKVKLELK
jgi:hypothetical protein